ncbi:MAG: methylase involved in ubiquinone/menaquinone biosynthesis [Verrucomicrobiales bacterium]|nr:methylase involved in ubiquinone/menaquinone biosynthesis [Verrucomicrobiales bacterium]
MSIETIANRTVNLDKPASHIDGIKARHKATWETGDFGQIAKYILPEEEQFVARLNLQPRMKVLDVACGNGNVATLAARRGCVTYGIDIASNLIAQARQRARSEYLHIEFTEGDAEYLPYGEANFDVAISTYGVMFAPRPERIVSELRRVVKPGGLIALANWTPDGFLGKVFAVFARHVPPPPGFPSPLLWGDEQIVRARFQGHGDDLQVTRRTARMVYPFDPSETVNFFRRYYGPTARAFDALKPVGQLALLSELIELQTEFNTSKRANETEVLSDYLEVHVRRAGAN